MSGSSGGDKPKIGLKEKLVIAAGAALLVFGICYGLINEAFYHHEAHQKASDYSENAARDIGKACVGTLLEQRDCIYEAANEYRLQARDNQREYDDLAAQRTSALWTGIMGVAALIGMALSSIGVALVWTTFREAKQANVIAAKAAHDQLRAYVVQHSGTAMRKRGAVGKIKIEAKCVISNQGQTPAYDVLFSVQCFYQIVQPKHESLTWGHTVPTVIGGGGRWQGQTTRDFTPDTKGKKRLYLLAEVRYRDHSGRKWVMYMASQSRGGSGRNLTQLICCKEGNFEREIIETDG